MTAQRWLLSACGLVAAGLVGQAVLLVHLAPANPDAYPALARPLAEVPLSLSGANGTWFGGDNRDLDKLRASLPFHADDLLSRGYHLQGTGVDCYVYAVHSRQGDDRKHHPEICIREVTGAPEDLAARAVLFLGDDKARPVQRFRFRTGTQKVTTVYYWHYTFAPAEAATQSALQKLHLLVGYPAPSVTIQVATALSPEQLGPLEQSFLPLLDQQLTSSHLPRPARMACDRMPITLIRR